MILQTKIPIKKAMGNLISHHSKIVLLGSCFSKNIGSKLEYYKFQTFQNPFGILFHPKAIENLILNAVNEKEYSENDLIFQNERWHSFDAHSSVSNSNKNILLENLHTAVKSTKKQLKEATHIFITLGTSWVYRFVETDAVVANCHKIPQKKFLKELLTVDEITESLESCLSLIQSVNKKASVVFTVSPVRHLKDGFIENMQSKAHLIAGIHQIDVKYQALYFPSYEIMMDELRDYRFYSEDMIHPNKTAINYIWNRFAEVYISDEAQKLTKEIELIQKGIAHKPFNENSKEHEQFKQKLQLKIERLNTKMSKKTF